MATHTPLPPALTAAVAIELLSTDIHNAHAARVQSFPAARTALSAIEQLQLAVLAIAYPWMVPALQYPLLPKEAAVPFLTPDDVLDFRSNRLRGELGPDPVVTDPVVTDADVDRAMDEAAALTRPLPASASARPYVDLPAWAAVEVAQEDTAAAHHRHFGVGVLAGIALAVCVFGWLLFEVVS